MMPRYSYIRQSTQYSCQKVLAKYWFCMVKDVLVKATPVLSFVIEEETSVFGQLLKGGS